MTDPTPSRLTTAAVALQKSPIAFTVLLLALNVVLNPYRGIYHDAILYGFQALNAGADGRYGDDLFFRYGSQDKFSAFSAVVGPFVARFGVPATFLVGYLLATGLYLFAVARLCRALIPNPVAGVGAAVLMATAPAAFAGLGVFHVPEGFFTPRLPATALSLLAVERLLRGRPAHAAGCVALALPLHPLMAFPVGLVVAGWVGLRVLPRWAVVTAGVAVVAGGVTLLLVEPLGVRLFGRMDAGWRESVRAVSPYHFPSEWVTADWLRIAVQFGVVAAAAWAWGGNAGRVLALILVVAAGGLAAAVIAPLRPYALLQQGQPFRALWLSAALAGPCALGLAARWWATDRVALKAAAITLVFAATETTVWTPQFGIFLVAATAVVVGFRATGRGPARVDTAAVFAVAAAVAAWELFRADVIARAWGDLTADIDPLEALHVLPGLAEPVTKLAVGLAVALAWATAGTTARAGLLTVAAAVGLGPPLVCEHPAFARAHRPGRADAEFVAAAVDPTAAPVTIYWPTDQPEEVWFTVGADHYLAWPNQIVGNMFSRPQAVEGDRRREVVRPFELERYHRPRPVADYFSELQYRLSFGTTDAAPPGAADLARLAADPAVDFAVVRLRVDGWFVATNGTWFVYDCRRLRGATPPPGSAEGTP